MLINDENRYAQLQAAQLKSWEATCTRCGACCGIAEGDPCEHLVEEGQGKYRCAIYENRFGLHHTRSGKEFRCVPIRDILHQSWPGDQCCGYKKAAKAAMIVVGMLLLTLPADAKNPDGKLLGMSRAALMKHYPKKEARTYRSAEREEWLTYNHSSGTVTFYLKDGKVADVKYNDRAEVVEEYLSEFCSPGFPPDSKIYTAIRNSLLKLPQDAFLAVTDRARPVIFTEYHYTSMGRFANSSNIISFKDDAPSMTDGLTIIKMSMEMDDMAQSPKEIEGVVLHELAHRVLEHAQRKDRSCKLEREANNLVKSWGYEEEFLAAKERFGDKTRTDAEKCPE